MAVPTFDQLLAPILRFASKQEISSRTATAAMILEFGLSAEDQSELIPSGTARIANRCGWAITHLYKAKLIERKARNCYIITAKGRDFLKKHQGPITVADMRKIPEWVTGWKLDIKVVNPVITPSLTTPEEIIENEVSTLRDQLREELLESLATVNPYRFEKIVLDVLVAMGYGGIREESAKVTSRSNDEGVDGIINEDRLGLDVIYVQAKRWKNRVGRQEIQAFVGALAGKQAQKGIFITTSDFAQNAYDYARSLSQKVILVDGPRLANLMIEHGVGVSTSRKIEIQKLDSDYFED